LFGCNTEEQEGEQRGKNKKAEKEKDRRGKTRQDKRKGEK
jgi:hypothetical protein